MPPVSVIQCVEEVGDLRHAGGHLQDFNQYKIKSFQLFIIVTFLL